MNKYQELKISTEKEKIIIDKKLNLVELENAELKKLIHSLYQSLASLGLLYNRVRIIAELSNAKDQLKSNESNKNYLLMLINNINELLDIIEERQQKALGDCFNDEDLFNQLFTLDDEVQSKDILIRSKIREREEL